MIRRLLIAAVPMLALVACGGMPDEGEDQGDTLGTTAQAVRVSDVPVAQLGAPGAVVPTLAVVTAPGMPPRLMVVAMTATASSGSGSGRGDEASSTQDPIIIRDGPSKGGGGGGDPGNPPASGTSDSDRSSTNGSSTK